MKNFSNIPISSVNSTHKRRVCSQVRSISEAESNQNSSCPDVSAAANLMSLDFDLAVSRHLFG